MALAASPSRRRTVLLCACVTAVSWLSGFYVGRLQGGGSETSEHVEASAPQLQAQVAQPSHVEASAPQPQAQAAQPSNELPSHKLPELEFDQLEPEEKDRMKKQTSKEQINSSFERMWAAHHCYRHGSGVANVQYVPPINILGPDGMVVDYTIGYSNKTGRGVYAAQHIKKGEMIWYGSRVVAFHEDEYKTFLDCLPKGLQHDAVMWSWADDNENEVNIALDAGSLVNHASNPNTGPHPSCLAQKVKCHLKCLQNNYATRDIKPGEELTDDYSGYDGSDDGRNNELAWFSQIEEAHGDPKGDLYMQPGAS